MRLSPAAGRGKLYGALKDLRSLWDRTTDVWDDPAQRDFEDDVFVPLDAHSQAALRTIDRLAQILSQVESDCS